VQLFEDLTGVRFFEPHCTDIDMVRYWTKTTGSVYPDHIISNWRWSFYVIFDTDHYEEFDSEEEPETEVVSSAILTINFRKRPKIAGNRPAFSEFEPPANSGGLDDAPARRFYSKYAECLKVGLLSKIRNWQLQNIAVVCKRAMKIPALVDRL